MFCGLLLVEIKINDNHMLSMHLSLTIRPKRLEWWARLYTEHLKIRSIEQKRVLKLYISKDWWKLSKVSFINEYRLDICVSSKNLNMNCARWQTSIRRRTKEFGLCLVRFGIAPGQVSCLAYCSCIACPLIDCGYCLVSEYSCVCAGVSCWSPIKSVWF